MADADTLDSDIGADAAARVRAATKSGPDLTTITSPSGARLTVAKSAAASFQGLINDLEAAGYKLDPATSGGYNPRNIAGTNTPSLHASGQAVDINWQRNPQGANASFDIPPDLARKLAAKYGLRWGGTFAGNRRDPMHFEIASASGAPMSTTTSQPTQASSAPPIDYDRLAAALPELKPYKDKLEADDARIGSLENGALNPPKLTPPPRVQPDLDPMQAFGQPAMWLAIFGSLATRRSLVNAINAAGGVLKSTQEQNTAAAQQAYNTWKIQTENGLKLAQFEQDAYKNAVAKKNSDVNQARAEVQVIAKAFENQALLDIFNREGMEGVEKYILARGRRLADAEAGAAGFGNTHGPTAEDTAATIAADWGSGDPIKQAEGMDLYAKQQAAVAGEKKGTASEQQATSASLVKWAGISRDLRSGDAAKIAAAQQQIAEIQGQGPGAIKPPSSSAAANKDKDADLLARDQFKKDHDGRDPGPGDEAEMAALRTKERENASGAMSPDEAKIFAQVALKTGHAPSSLGRSQANIAAFAHAYQQEAQKAGLTADQIAANIVQFQSEMSQGRALGTQLARIDLGARELDVALPQARELSEKAFRPGFKPLAVVQQALQGASNDPDLLEFAQQNQAVINAYAQTMARGGLSTVSGMERAEHLLSTATSQTAYLRQLDRIHKEAQTILYGSQAARQDLLNEITGGDKAVPAPKLTGLQKPKPPLPDAEIISKAKERITAEPKMRDAVVEQLKAWNVDTSGL